MDGTMKNYKKKMLQISTLLLVAVFVLSAASVFFTPAQQSGELGVNASNSIAVNNITDKVNSLSASFALSNDDLGGYSINDSCWVIVRFKDSSILDRAMQIDSSDIYSYINSDAAIKQANEINKAQDKFAKKYRSIIEETSFRYNALFNGLAVKVRYGDIAKLEKDSSVSSVIICERYEVPQAVTQNQVNVYETGIYDPGDVGYDGTGTVVAVLDTGLDYTHSAFAEQPTGTLVLQKDNIRALLSSFSATAMSSSVGVNLSADDLYVSDKVPFAYDYADMDADVYPTEDHGTHVAGIIAGHDDVITGIATNAQLAIMKVFSNVVDQGAGTEGILAALNDCVVLGVDAINMSLGSSCGFARESDDDAVNSIYDKIRETGICLICAASNDYSAAYQSENGDTSLVTNPDYGTVGSPSTYEAAMSVASISGVKTRYLMINDELEAYFTEVGNTGSIERHFAEEVLKGQTRAEYEYVVIPGLGTESNYLDLDVRGKIAVIKRGSTSFEDKITLAQNKGAVAAIVYNNVTGTISMSVGKAKIPACSVSMEVGKYFEGHTTGKLVVDLSYEAGPFMSEFSSWGPLPSLELKPDITAHGGDIYSAVRGGYDHFSGTSMASPNMAGATILVRQFVKETYPELSPYEVTELTYQLMMSTATIAYNEEGNPYSPRKQGAGLADISKSVTASSYIYVEGQNKTKLSLGDDPEKTGVYEMTFNVRNLGSSAQSYLVNPIVMTESLSSDNKTVTQKAYMLGDTGVEVSVSGNGAKLSAGNTLLLAGYATASVTVKLTLSQDAIKYLDKIFVNGTYIEGYVQLLSQNGDVDLNVPYLAFYGDWSVAPMLDVTAYEVGEQQEDPSILEEDKLKADIYATLPMSGFRYISGTDGNGDYTYEETYYGMGQFAYKIADGYSEPAIIEDKASLSIDLDGSYSIRAIAAGLLRNAKRVEMKIADSITGEVIWTGSTVDVRKSFFSGSRYPGFIDVDFNAIEYNLPNNSRYTFSMECFLDWDSTQNNKSNTFSFDFYVDNEAPILVDEQTQVRVESSNGTKRYYLDFYVYDNHYLQAYQLGSFGSIDENGNYVNRVPFHNYVIPAYDAKRNSVTRFTYEITQYWDDIWANDGKLYVELIDYAKNTTDYEITLPSSLADTLGFRTTMRQVNTRVNEMVDLKDYLVTTPSDLWVKDLIWSIDDETVATVVDGVVLGLGEGNTTVRVTNKDGTAEASLPVQVRAANNDKINLTRIQLNKNRNSIERGEEFTLSASLIPHDVFKNVDPSKFSNVNLRWTTSGGMVKFVVTDVNGEEQLVDSVEGVSSVTIRAMRSGAAVVNVLDANSTSRVSSSCSISIKSEFEVEGGYLKSYTGRGDENGVVEIPDDLGVYYIYPYAFMNNPYITKVVVPDGVIQIMEAAIYGCDNLEEIVLPDSCKTLTQFAFGWNPKLTKVDLGGVNTIGELAFVGCSSLKTIDLSRVFAIGDNAFRLCDGLETIDLSSIKSMGFAAFAECTSLKEVITADTTPIGGYAFMYCDSLQAIEINSKTIGEFAFFECPNLQSVTFNNAVDTIGVAAFHGCIHLKNVEFKSTVRVIDDIAFANCAFEQIVIPNGVEKLGTFAYGLGYFISGFDHSFSTIYGGASEVVISAGAKLTTIGAGLFEGNTNLRAFTVERGNAYMSSVDGILYDKAQRKVLLVPHGYPSSTVVLPDTVVEIGEGSFSMSNVTSVTGTNVTKIADEAFYFSTVRTLNLGQVTYIGESAFYYATNLISWQSCFNNVEYIGNDAFLQSGMAGTLVLPETLTYLGEYAFAATNITSLTTNSGLKSIGDYAFAQSNLQYVLLNEELESIGAYAFAWNTKLTSISIPDSVTKVGAATFLGCSRLSSVKLSENMTEIAPSMFINCSALTSIVLPESIKSIGDAAFANFSADGYLVYGALASINLYNVEYIGIDAFIGTNITSINAPNLVTIDHEAFAYSSVREVNIPNVTFIGDNAFMNCDALKSVRADSLQYVGISAFQECSSLKEIDLSNAVSIGHLAFYGATSLESVSLGKLETLGTGAFAGTAITSIYLPATLHTISVQGLYAAEELAEVIVDEANPWFFTVDDGVLYKRVANGLVTLVYFPAASRTISYAALENTVRVEAFAFAGNTRLQTVVLPERLQVLGAGAFYGCTRLKTIQLNSAAAPVLEMYYDSDLGVANHFYDIFQTNIAMTETKVEIIYPANGTGYDAYNWMLYLKENLKQSDVIVRTQTTLDILDTLTALNKEDLTVDDIAQVVLLRRIYESLDSAQKQFLADVVSKLSDFEKQLGKLISEMIASLSDNVTEEDRETVELIRRLYNQGNDAIQANVTNIDKLDAAEQKLNNSDGQPKDPNTNNWVLPVVLSIVGVVVCAAAAVAVVLILKRKKIAQGNVTEVQDEQESQSSEQEAKDEEDQQ